MFIAMLLSLAAFSYASVYAHQSGSDQDKPVLARTLEGKPESPGKVQVKAVAKDTDIRQRLADILVTTGWFGNPTVTDNDESRQWATDLATNTEGVILADHPAVLREPEPLVLVEDLGAYKVNLRVYFWLDGRQHSWVKVKSSVIRFVKGSFQASGISLPDEARAITFPHRVPVHMVTGDIDSAPAESVSAKPKAEPETVATEAEDGLQSEAEEIKRQARGSWTPGENLLGPQTSGEAST